MGMFMVEGKDGKRYRVEAPSPEAAAAAVKKMMADAPRVDGRNASTAERIAAAKAGTLEMQPGSAERAAGADAAALAQMGGRGQPMTPDGRTTAPGTTPEQAGRIPEGMVFDPRTGGYVDAALVAERMGPAQGANANFISGAPFVGEWADEGAGRLDAAMTGRNPEIAQEVFRESRQQFAEANPGAATALQIGGGVVGSLPLASAAASTLPLRGATMRGTVARVAGASAAGAGAEGVVQGAGAGRTPDERARMAALGGAMGVGIGGALGAAGPFAAQGISNLVRRARKLPLRAIMDEFGVEAPAARIIKRALENDDLDAAARRLAAAGDDAMLADSGDAGAALLDAAAQTGGEALRVSRNAVGDRAEAAGARLPGKLDDILGERMGVRTAARGIAQSTAAARSEAYERALAQPINYGTGEAGEAVLEVVNRVPSRVLRQAIDEANEEIQSRAELVGTKQILASIGDDGRVTFSELPNLRQMDELKKALQSIGAEAVDQFGRPTSAGNRAGRLAAELRDALVAAVPDYETALKLGQDKILRDRALDIGNRLLRRNTTLEEVREFVDSGLSNEAAEAARQGLREGIESAMSNVRRTITDDNVAAREAMQLIKDMSSRENIGKVRLLLGERRAAELMRELDQATMALELRAAVARNSATAIRQGIQNEARAELAPGVLRQVAGEVGNPLEALKPVSRALAGIDPETMSDAERRMFTDIARALTGIRGADAQRALRVVRQTMQGAPMTQYRADLIAKQVATPAFLSAYQTLTQTPTQ
jgi:hypothetical protein